MERMNAARAFSDLAKIAVLPMAFSLLNPSPLMPLRADESTLAPALAEPRVDTAAAANGEEGAGTLAAINSAHFADPAFDRYVDLNLLGRAWRKLDAAMLTDGACQLMEGERILLRSHKLLSSEQVLQKVIQIAVERKDETTLKRLTRVLERRPNPGLQSQLQAALKLAAGSRGENTALLVDPRETAAEAFEACQAFLAAMAAGRLSRDRKALDDLAALQQAAGLLRGLGKQERERLLTELAASRSAIPEDAIPDSTARVLEQLSAASREPDGNDSMSVVRSYSETILDHPDEASEPACARARRFLEVTDRRVWTYLADNGSKRTHIDRFRELRTGRQITSTFRRGS
jgi:hypothetical protein